MGHTLTRTHPADRATRNGHREAYRQLAEIAVLPQPVAETASSDRLQRVLQGPAPEAFKVAFERTFTDGMVNLGIEQPS